MFAVNLCYNVHRIYKFKLVLIKNMYPSKISVSRWLNPPGDRPTALRRREICSSVCASGNRFARDHS